MPVYVIERNFAEQLDMSSDEVNLLEEINADEGVSWLFSFLSADRHRSYCLYEAPSPDAIIAAAKRAGIPADVVTEVSRITADTFRCPAAWTERCLRTVSCGTVWALGRSYASGTRVFSARSRRFGSLRVRR